MNDRLLISKVMKILSGPPPYSYNLTEEECSREYEIWSEGRQYETGLDAIQAAKAIRAAMADMVPSLLLMRVREDGRRTRV